MDCSALPRHTFTFLAIAHTLVGLHDMRDVVADVCGVMADVGVVVGVVFERVW